jgi:hypothetical protein
VVDDERQGNDAGGKHNGLPFPEASDYDPRIYPVRDRHEVSTHLTRYSMRSRLIRMAMQVAEHIECGYRIETMRL